MSVGNPEIDAFIDGATRWREEMEEAWKRPPEASACPPAFRASVLRT